MATDVALLDELSAETDEDFGLFFGCDVTCNITCTQSCGGSCQITG